MDERQGSLHATTNALGRGGDVTFVQQFGSTGSLHPATTVGTGFHMLALEGVNVPGPASDAENS